MCHPKSCTKFNLRVDKVKFSVPREMEVTKAVKLPRTIYAIQHNKTKRIYIGSSSDVPNRYWSHIYKLRNGKHGVEDMQKDFDEHGEDFSLFILDEINTHDERIKEYECMNKYQSNIRGKGYNYKDHAKKFIQIGKLPLKSGVPSI